MTAGISSKELHDPANFTWVFGAAQMNTDQRIPTLIAARRSLLAWQGMAHGNFNTGDPDDQSDQTEGTPKANQDRSTIAKTG
jgi:hypothetical protein